MFCSQCGKEIPDDSRLCCYCGKLAVQPVFPAKKQEPETAPEEQSAAPALDEGFVAPVLATPKKKPWLLICGIAMAVILAVLAIILLCSNDKTNPQVSDDNAADQNTPEDDKVDLWVLENVYVEHEGEKHLAMYCTYDEQGNMIELGDRHAYALLDYPFNTIEYTYNENGDCIRIVDNCEIVRRNLPGVQPTITMYSYTYEDGKKTEKYKETENGKQLIEKYYYNDDTLSEIIWYSSDGEETTQKTFDEDGRLTVVEMMELWEEQYFYDDNGQLKIIKRYSEVSGESELKSMIELYYDSNGNLAEVEIKDKAGEILDTSFKTDKQGNILEGDFAGLTFSYEYKKFRVSREQALKLIDENTTVLLTQAYIDRENRLYYWIEE